MATAVDVDDPWEVVVVGGGPAGAVAARTLAQKGRRVLLLEAGRYRDWRAGETLYPSIRKLLAALGVTDRFEALETVRSAGIRSYWGSEEPSSESFLHSTEGAGWHVDRTAFDRMLFEAAREAGASARLGHRVTSCAAERLFSLSVNAVDAEEAPFSETVRARVVIDATGRSAMIATQFEAEREVRDRLVAAAVVFSTGDDGIGRYTLIEAVSEGWWYSAPLPGDRAITCFFTDADMLGERRDREPWREALIATSATADRIEEATIEQGPTVAPALSHQLQREGWGRRWLAVGDATMGVDPLSGRGIERAIDTGVRGALAVDKWLNGADEQVRRYREDLAGSFEAYLKRRYDYYGLENRWPDSPFWERRHGGDSGAP